MAKKGPGRGRRGAVPRIGGRFASTKAPAATSTVPPPPPEVKTAEAEVEKKIGILEALLEKQKQLSGGETELSTAVLGKGGTKGVRAQIEQLVRENRERLQDLDDPNNAANFAVIESALALSEQALRSKDRKEQVDIYNKLKFIREVAEKTTGDKSDVTKKIAEIIKPVEGALKSKTGFAAFAKERLVSSIKSAPEAIVRQIPLVGGLLGDYMQEKRAGREELEAYAGRRVESISQAGKRSNELEKILMGRGIGGGGVVPPFRGASTIGSMVGGAAGAGLAGLATGESSTLGQIAADVRAIKEGIIGKKSGTEALKEKEKAIKDMAGVTKADEKQKGLFGGLGKTLSGMLGGGGLLSGLAGMFGMGGREAGQPGILSQATDWAADKATNLGLKKGWEGAKGLASKGWQGAKSMLGFGANAAEGGGSWLGKAWEGAKGLASSGIEGIKSAGGAAWQAGKAVAGEAASIAKAVASPVQFLKGNAGKILGGMKALGPIAAVIEPLIGAANIYSIKNDPNIPPEQKKEMIGAEIAKRFGSAIGGILGGGLGSAIGPVGTVLGGVVGAMGGEWVGNQIAELIGPKGIYDFVSSIPIIGEGIKVEEAPKAGVGAEGEKPATGTVAPTPTAATPAGQQVSAMEMNRRGVEEVRDYAAKQSQAQAAVMAQTKAATQNMYNQSNTVVNNYNDDLRVRNSEATLKMMERNTLP